MRPRSPKVESIRWRRAALAAAVLVLAGGRGASGADQPVPVISVTAARPAAAPAPAVTYDTYRFIGDWNIFNPFRVGRTMAQAAPPPVETITLVGTMRYEKGLFAFFDSPESAYRKELHEGDTIAQFTVKHIEADKVELTRDAKALTLAMGQQLRRPPGGDWSVGAAPQVVSAPSGMAAPVIPADASDILRKLMEQRQKQLKQ